MKFDINITINKTKEPEVAPTEGTSPHQPAENQPNPPSVPKPDKENNDPNMQSKEEQKAGNSIKGSIVSEYNVVTPISIAEDSKLTSKDAYTSYWRCRDFELTYLWQRSIFLSAFLLFFCSAYGVLVTKMLDKLPDKRISDIFQAVTADSSSWVISNGFAILIVFIIMILACFWIMTAKASKYWYEIYENAIDAYTKDASHINKNDADAIKILGFQYGALENYKFPNTNDKLRSSDGGEFSLSRINWAIGYLFLWIGRILLVVHCSILGGCIGWGVVGIGIILCGLPCVIRNCKKLRSTFDLEKSGSQNN